MQNDVKISNVVHREQESIINRIDQAISESEQELATGAAAVDAEIVFAELEKRLR